MAPGARQYTQAELLSLRAIPGSRRRSTPQRQLSSSRRGDERPRERGGVRRIFAAGDGSHVLVSAASGGGVERAPGPLASHARDFLPVLRYGRGLASLNLYPTSAACVATNELLWQAAHAGEHAAAGDALLGTNVLALAMSEELFGFLRRVSLPGLRRCVLEFLALLAADETAEGLALMAGELEPDVWEDLCTLRADDVRPGGQSLRDVEALRAMCCLSPWRVDVYAAYVTPTDMRAVLTAKEHEQDEPTPSGAEGGAGGQYTPPNLAAKIRARAPSKNVVYWKLFCDWQTYRRIWVQRLGVHPADAAAAMCAAVADGRHNAAWGRAEVVLMCAARSDNLFSAIPKDVVCNILAPHVLLAGCADRRELSARSATTRNEELRIQAGD